MYRLLKTSLLIGSIAVCLPASAARISDPCRLAAKNQADVNECSTQSYKAADLSLNRVYKEVTAGLNKKQNDKLKDAQRAWIAFRDADCEARAFDYTGGSMYTSVYTDCLAELTRERTDEMMRVYQGAEEQGDAGSIAESSLVGTWRTMEGDYGMEITLGLDNGIHHYLSKLNNLPFEAGQWQLSNGQLSIISNTGKELHVYPRIKLEDGVLTLFEQDGGFERFKKLDAAP